MFKDELLDLREVLDYIKLQAAEVQEAAAAANAAAAEPSSPPTEVWKGGQGCVGSLAKCDGFCPSVPASEEWPTAERQCLRKPYQQPSLRHLTRVPQGCSCSRYPSLLRTLQPAHLCAALLPKP